MRVTSIWQKILSLIVTPHDEILEVYEVVTSPVKREVDGFESHPAWRNPTVAQW